MIWHIEIANILTLKVRDRVLSAVELREAVSLLRQLNIETDEVTKQSDFEALIRLTETVQLTTYDALYIDLAKRTGLPIATFDKAMLEAARQKNIPIITIT